MAKDPNETPRTMVTMHHRTTKGAATATQNSHGKSRTNRDGGESHNHHHQGPMLSSFAKAFTVMLAITALYAVIKRDERPQTQTYASFLPPLDPATNVPGGGIVLAAQENKQYKYQHNNKLAKLNTNTVIKIATPCPKKFRKLFWMSVKKINKPVAPCASTAGMGKNPRYSSRSSPLGERTRRRFHT